MFKSISEWLVKDFGRSRPILWTRTENCRYRPGRLDIRLLLDPRRQSEFEKKWSQVAAVRRQSIAAEEKKLSYALNSAEQARSAAVREADRLYDGAMRALIAEYGQVPPEEVKPVLDLSMSRALGAVAEA